MTNHTPSHGRVPSGNGNVCVILLLFAPSNELPYLSESGREAFQHSSDIYMSTLVKIAGIVNWERSSKLLTFVEQLIGEIRHCDMKYERIKMMRVRSLSNG